MTDNTFTITVELTEEEAATILQVWQPWEHVKGTAERRPLFIARAKIWRQVADHYNRRRNV